MLGLQIFCTSSDQLQMLESCHWLRMRVQKMPVREEAVLKDLQTAIMYWHGRDRSCRPVLVWRMEKVYALGHWPANIFVVKVLRSILQELVRIIRSSSKTNSLRFSSSISDLIQVAKHDQQDQHQHAATMFNFI